MSEPTQKDGVARGLRGVPHQATCVRGPLTSPRKSLSERELGVGPTLKGPVHLRVTQVDAKPLTSTSGKRKPCQQGCKNPQLKPLPTCQKYLKRHLHQSLHYKSTVAGLHINVTQDGTNHIQISHLPHSSPSSPISSAPPVSLSSPTLGVVCGSYCLIVICVRSLLCAPELSSIRCSARRALGIGLHSARLMQRWKRRRRSTHDMPLVQ